MPIPESFGLAALTWELCAEGLKGIVGNRADALAVSAWGHIRERFQGLDLPDYQVLQRAVAAAHWEAVKQAASLYGPGLEARGMGVMAQADQRALKALREHAQARVHELADTSRSLPVGQDEELQEALGRLEEPSVGTGGLRGYAELVFQALPGAGDLSPGFREYFVVQWFDLLASNFQRKVQSQPEAANQLFGKFLAEIHLKLPDGRMVGEEEWRNAFAELARAAGRIEQKVDGLHGDVDGLHEKLDRILAPQRVERRAERLIDLPALNVTVLDREQECEAVLAELRQPGPGVIAVTAPPGFGKTWLLRKVLQKVTDGTVVQVGGPRAVAWIDCGKPERPELRQALTLDRIAATVSRAVDGVDGGEGGALDRVFRVLARAGEMWVVIDNLETALVNEHGVWRAADPEARCLIEEWGEKNHSAKLVLLSRLETEGLRTGRVVTDGLRNGLPEPDATKLLSENLRGSILEGTALSTLAGLGRRVHCVPMALVAAAGYLKAREHDLTVEQLLSSEKLFADFDRKEVEAGTKKLIAAHLALLEPEAMRVVSFLAFFGSAVPREAVLLLPEAIPAAGRITALVRGLLVAVSEPDRISGVYCELHPTVVEVARSVAANSMPAEVAGLLMARAGTACEGQRFRLAVDLFGMAELALRSRPEEERMNLAETLASAVMNKGVALRRLGRLEEAIGCSEEAIGILRGLAKTRQGEPSDDLAGAVMNKGLALASLERWEEALGRYEEAIGILRGLVGAGRGELANNLAGVLMNKGVALQLLGRLEEALRCYEEAIGILRGLVGAGRGQLANDLAAAVMNKGNALQSLGRLGEAVGCYGEAIKIRRERVAAGRGELSSGLATALHRIWRLLRCSWTECRMPPCLPMKRLPFGSGW